MKEDKVFHYALVASLLIHIGLFAKISYANRNLFKKPLNTTEIVYQKFKVNERHNVKVEEIGREKNKRAEKDEKILLKKKALSDRLKEDVSKIASAFKIRKRKITKMDYSVKRKISIPVFQSEKGANPKYSHYHQTIRRKIKERAYFYVDNFDFETGEVYLTFALLADGTLKEVRIIESKTSANEYLRGVGLRSIKESSPFPPFPKDLNYPELSFNVVISFELQE